jgi:hypothetical protein
VYRKTRGFPEMGDPQNGYNLIIYNPMKIMKIVYLGPSLGHLHIIFGNPALFNI